MNDTPEVTGWSTMLRPWLPTSKDAEQRMSQLLRYMDDPSDPECDWQTLTLVLALRSALSACAEVLLLYDEERDNRSYELGQLYVARKVVHRIVQQLMDMPHTFPRPIKDFDDD